MNLCFYVSFASSYAVGSFNFSPAHLPFGDVRAYLFRISLLYSLLPRQNLANHILIRLGSERLCWQWEFLTFSPYWHKQNSRREQITNFCDWNLTFTADNTLSNKTACPSIRHCEILHLLQFLTPPRSQVERVTDCLCFFTLGWTSRQSGGK